MRKKIFTVLLIFGVIQTFSGYLRLKPAYCLEAVSGHALSDPMEEVDANTWDFGTVKQGEVLKHDFMLVNQTKEDLKINSIHTSCGCTASEAGKKTLLPQESTAITVTFNSHGYLGAVRQFVYVNTSDADQPIIKFTIKVNVVKD